MLKHLKVEKKNPLNLKDSGRTLPKLNENVRPISLNNSDKSLAIIPYSVDRNVNW